MAASQDNVPKMYRRKEIEMNEIESIFTLEFWLIFAVEILFGIVIATILWLLRKYEFLPDDPGSSVVWLVVGVGGTVAISSSIIGWVNVIYLAAFFIATGAPQGIYTVVAIVDAKRREISKAVK